jgi:hypothetical protein
MEARLSRRLTSREWYPDSGTEDLTMRDSSQSLVSAWDSAASPSWISLKPVSNR